MIKVYFEYKSYTELVATFESEALYIKCLESLMKEAFICGAKVTESLNEN